MASLSWKGRSAHESVELKEWTANQQGDEWKLTNLAETPAAPIVLLYSRPPPAVYHETFASFICATQKKKERKKITKSPNKGESLNCWLTCRAQEWCVVAERVSFFCFFCNVLFFRQSVCRCCSQISPKFLSPESLREFAVQRGLQGQTWSHPHLFMKMMKVNKTPLFVPSPLPRLLFWISIHSCASSQLERCTAAPSAYNWTCAA